MFLSYLVKKREQGQALLEYSMVLLLVAIAVIVIVAFFGDTVYDQYCSITYQILPEGDISSACIKPIITTKSSQGANFLNLEAVVYDPDGDPNNPTATINKVEFYLDSTNNLIRTESVYRFCLGAGDASCQNYDISGLPSGSHTIIMLAYDADGNVGKKSFRFKK